MRRTKYHSNYGYVSHGGGIGDVFTVIKNAFSRLPPSIIEAGKKAGTKIATSGITAAGDRVGSALANRIAPPDRKKVLKDIKLSPDIKLSEPSTDIHQLGFGKKKIRGKGIKILR